MASYLIRSNIARGKGTKLHSEQHFPKRYLIIFRQWLMVSPAAVISMILWTVPVHTAEMPQKAPLVSIQTAQAPSDKQIQETQDWEAPSLGSHTYKERVNYVRELVHDQERLALVSHRLATGVVELCGERLKYTTGAFLFDWDLTSNEWVDAANDAIGINLHLPGIEVLIMVPESPAEQAGLQVGDRIVRLGKWRVPARRGAFTAFHRRLNELLEQGSAPIELGIQRDSKFLTVVVTPVQSCDYPAILLENDDINALTDGGKIGVNRGVMKFVKDDDELAIIVAHELAHIVLGHVEEARKNTLSGRFVGSVFDILLAAATGVYTNVGMHVGSHIGALAYSKESEAEADYMGSYMAAIAGYDFSSGPGLMQRLESVSEKAAEYSLTHPMASERRESAEKTAKEMQQKIDAQIPLFPEWKN